MAREVILIVDDEASMLELLEYNLKREGYSVVAAYNGKEALEIFRNEHIALLVLDVMMPEVDGFEVCREVRKTSNTPIIMVTAKSSETNKIVGLELGADDYVTKPFSVSELMARIKAVLRRSNSSQDNEATGEHSEIVRENIRINTQRREVHIGETRVDLTMKEFDLLHLMASNPGIVYSRERILDAVWGGDSYIVDRAIDVHVRHLRQKIEESGGAPDCIATIRGIGYRFETLDS